MGWWPVKLCVLLNLVILIGYAMIDAVVAGQMLSAVSHNGSLTVQVGIVITAIITWVVTSFGIKVFHLLERYYNISLHLFSADHPRYAFIPQTIVLIILAGVAGPKFDTQTESTVTGATLAGNRLTFFSICLSAGITYAPDAADFLVYVCLPFIQSHQSHGLQVCLHTFPNNKQCDPRIASRWKVFLATLLGLSLSFTFTFVLGCGLASGLQNDPSWEAAGAGTGALIVAGFSSLGTFGSFCSVLSALGLIANMVPPIYVCGNNFQILGRYFAVVPRFVWNTFACVVFTVCALAGKDHLSEIFTNFLALMGYCTSSPPPSSPFVNSHLGVVIYLAIALEEEFLFHGLLSPTASLTNPSFNWAAWNTPSKLPIGIAAFLAFGIGWVGAVLCMAQYYYIGPLAKLVGDDGADMGNYVGFAWAAVVYPPARWVELRLVGR